MDHWLTLFLAVLVVALGWTFLKRIFNPTAFPLPPGPPADPLIGHLRVFPPLDYQAEVFREWAKTYGDVIYLEVLGKKIVVLDSLEAANDLLDKRRPKYSNRPRFAVFELLGLDKTLFFLQYGKLFNLHRKLFQTYFGAKECREFVPVQVQGAHLLVKNLLATPKEYASVIESFSASLILRIAYGYEIKGNYKDDPVVKVISEIVNIAKDSSIAMTVLDVFPWFKYLPGWFPGAYWTNYARENKGLADNFHNFAFEIVQNQMKEGIAKTSFVSTHLTHIDPGLPGAEKEAFVEAVKLTAAQIYVAGAETTASTLIIFLMAMVLFPDAQARAQAEIDNVVGSGRLPTFEDRPDLSCIDNILYEVARWCPIVPLGIPHASSEDDIYRGMLIPKGSLIFPNLRSMGLNSEIYEHPETFNQDRYKPKDKGGNGEPPFSSFGFGARICPGRFMAENSLWIAIAVILATCKISKERDEDGNENTPKLEFHAGTIRELKPFPFKMEPRSSKAMGLIENTQLH